MRHDSLATLIKVRRFACDDALRKLAAILAQADRTHSDIQRVERAIAEETLAASSPDGADAIVEIFGVWLVTTRRQLAIKRRLLNDQQSEIVRARAELTACRTALESIEALQEQRRVAADRAREAAETRDLQDRPFLPSIEDES